MPQPNQQDVDQIVLAVQARTGVTLEPSGYFRVLSRKEWQDCVAALQERAGKAD